MMLKVNKCIWPSRARALYSTSFTVFVLTHTYLYFASALRFVHIISSTCGNICNYLEYFFLFFTYTVARIIQHSSHKNRGCEFQDCKISKYRNTEISKFSDTRWKRGPPFGFWFFFPPQRSRSGRLTYTAVLLCGCAMATRLAFAVASRAKPPVLRVASALKAPGLRVNPHACHPYRGSAAAFISSSSQSRTSTRTTTGENNTAPSSTASAAAVGAATATPAATAQSAGSATIGTDGAVGAAGAKGSSSAASAGSETVSSGTSSSDPSSSVSGGGGGDGGSRGPLSWGAVGLLGIVATLAVGYYRMKWDEKQNQTASKVMFHAGIYQIC